MFSTVVYTSPRKSLFQRGKDKIHFTCDGISCLGETNDPLLRFYYNALLEYTFLHL